MSIDSKLESVNVDFYSEQFQLQECEKLLEYIQKALNEVSTLPCSRIKDLYASLDGLVGLLASQEARNKWAACRSKYLDLVYAHHPKALLDRAAGFIEKVDSEALKRLAADVHSVRQIFHPMSVDVHSPWPIHPYLTAATAIDRAAYYMDKIKAQTATGEITSLQIEEAVEQAATRFVRVNLLTHNVEKDEYLHTLKAPLSLHVKSIAQTHRRMLDELREAVDMKQEETEKIPVQPVRASRTSTLLDLQAQQALPQQALGEQRKQTSL